MAVRSEILLLDRGGRGLDVGREPLQAFEETFAGGSAAGHHEPELVLELVELECLGDLLWVHRCMVVGRSASISVGRGAPGEKGVLTDRP